MYNPGSAGSEFGERTGPNLDLAGSEFGAPLVYRAQFMT